MASFYTEQQSVDIREGLARRVKKGWFIGQAPYGHKNVRREGRSIVEVDQEAASDRKRIFQLYAYENQTFGGIIPKIAEEARVFRPSTRKFARASVDNFLRDRAYIDELEYKGNWYLV